VWQEAMSGWEVKHGAECHTAHHLLRIKLKMAPLWEEKDENSGKGETRKRFQEAVQTRIQDSCVDDESVEDKWVRLESSLLEVAKSELSYEQCKRPDWFKDSMDSLEPLLCQKNHLYDKWLSTGHTDDHRRFCGAHTVAIRAIRMAKNSWYQQKVKEA